MEVSCNGKVTGDPFTPITEEMLLLKLETAVMHADQGKYRDADKVVSDLRKKYGL